MGNEDYVFILLYVTGCLLRFGGLRGACLPLTSVVSVVGVSSVVRGGLSLLVVIFILVLASILLVLSVAIGIAAEGSSVLRDAVASLDGLVSAIEWDLVCTACA